MSFNILKKIEKNASIIGALFVTIWITFLVLLNLAETLPIAGLQPEEKTEEAIPRPLPENVPPQCTAMPDGILICDEGAEEPANEKEEQIAA